MKGAHFATTCVAVQVKMHTSACIPDAPQVVGCRAGVTAQQGAPQAAEHAHVAVAIITAVSG
jgi:hypothetical protein